ncbi:hypothetical protein DFH27DRAFT_261033 [Peziza echinospora]|nr:hypothetical protein DFH27DRAFT_261033 [Peziza echinospora]
MTTVNMHHLSAARQLLLNQQRNHNLPPTLDRMSSMGFSFMDARAASFMAESRISFMDETPDVFANQSLGVLIDREGDMFLCTKATHFQVSSKVLSLASPVFAAIFRGQQIAFGTALRLDMTTGETPDALELVLSIIHHRGREYIPTLLAPEHLSKVAIICQKYQLADALSAWSYRWIRAIPWKEKLTDAVQWLALSWVLRDEGTFKAISRHLIRNSKQIRPEPNSNALPIVIDANGHKVAGEGIPPIVVEAISISMTELHTNMAKAVETVLMRYLMDQTLCQYGHGKVCDRVQMAKVVHHLRKMGIEPISGVGITYPNNIPTFSNLEQHSPNSNLGDLKFGRRSIERILHLFKGFAEGYSKELPDDHRECSPFPMLYEQLKKMDTPGLNVWELLKIIEAREESSRNEAASNAERQNTAAREIALIRDIAARIAREEELGNANGVQADYYYMQNQGLPHH